MFNEIQSYFRVFLRHMPGRTGAWIRRLWGPRNFGNCAGYVNIQEGCFFQTPENMYFGERVSIGMNSYFFASGGRIEIGDQSAFNINVHINASVGGAIRIGSQCLIGPNVVMRTANHKYQDREVPIRKQGHSVKNIIIGDDCWIGANATILGGVKVGDGAVVGAGAVVTKSVSPYSIVGGVPARLIKFRGDGEAVSG